MREAGRAAFFAEVNLNAFVAFGGFADTDTGFAQFTL